MLEQSWPEIGWHLLCVRYRRNSTIEDIQKIFEPVKAKPHNPGIAAAFYRESSEPGNVAEIRANRARYGKLDTEIHQAQVKRDEQQRLCLDAEAALKIANGADRDAIQEEFTSRQQRLVQLDGDLKSLMNERDNLYKRLLDQGAYVSRSELLGFLLSRRYAVNPRTLANAVAGLPTMKWRQSFTRCSRMPFSSEPSFEYRVLEAISDIWSGQSGESKAPPLEFFRAELLKIPKTVGYTRQFLWDNWSDMKLAIEECWKAERTPVEIPFVLSSIFLRNATRQKNPAERILAERDKLGG